MEPNDTADLAPDTTPQWDSLPEDIPCPRCGYNLRMLTHARCPECGREFVWPDVIASAQSIATCPSFEYQARRRPVRSFLWTTRRIMLPPWRLWRELPTTGPVRPFRLLLFAVLNFLLIELTFAVGWWLTTFVLGRWAVWHSVISRGGEVSDVVLLMAKYLWTAFRMEAEYAPFEFLTAATLAVVTWMALMLFWQTRAKHQIRWSVCLRIMCYSWVTTLWGYVLTAIVAMFVRTTVAWHGSDRLRNWLWRYPVSGEDFATLASILCLLACLGYGLQRYLPRHQAWSLVGLLAILEALLVLVTMVMAAMAFDSWRNPLTEAIASLCPILAGPFLAAW